MVVLVVRQEQVGDGDELNAERVAVYGCDSRSETARDRNHLNTHSSYLGAEDQQTLGTGASRLPTVEPNRPAPHPTTKAMASVGRHSAGRGRCTVIASEPVGDRCAGRGTSRVPIGRPPACRAGLARDHSSLDGAAAT